MKTRTTNNKPQIRRRGTKSSDLAHRPIRPGPWADYLAGRPEVANRFYEVVEHLNAGVAEYRRSADDTSKKMVTLAESARQIGSVMMELEEMFAGKKLTEDFWHQIEPLFVDSSGRKIEREQLLWFGRMAKRFPEPITEIGQVLGAQSQLLLSGEFEEATRGPQYPSVQTNPLLALKEILQFDLLEKKWKAVLADVNFCPGGKLRPDLRATLAFELAPTFKVLDEFRRELGI